MNCLPYSTAWGNFPWFVVTWKPKQLLGDLLSWCSSATREQNCTGSGMSFAISMYSLDWTSGIFPRRTAQAQRMALFCRAQSWSEIPLLTPSSLSLLLRISETIALEFHLRGWLIFVLSLSMLKGHSCLARQSSCQVVVLWQVSVVELLDPLKHAQSWVQLVEA
jgi:hypothetical protein